MLIIVGGYPLSPPPPPPPPGKFRNAGQTCVCPNRIFVQEGIYDKYVSALKEKVSALQVGHGLQPGVQLVRGWRGEGITWCGVAIHTLAPQCIVVISL